MSSIIEVANLSFSYGPEPIIKDLSLSVNTGEFLAIAGANGAGKSTLLNILCGLLKANTGTVNIESKDITSYDAKSLARRIAVVRQEFVPVFDFTVFEIVAMARTPYMSTLGFETDSDTAAIRRAMEVTDTYRFANRGLANLSGGERQRVFIARALAQETTILLLDEPTSYLDFKHQVDIYDLLKEAQQQTGKTIIAVTHDINLAVQYCDRALLLFRDKKYLLGDIETVFCRETIEQAFDVKTSEATIGSRKFFLPQGRLSQNITPDN